MTFIAQTHVHLMEIMQEQMQAFPFRNTKERIEYIADRDKIQGTWQTQFHQWTLSYSSKNTPTALEFQNRFNRDITSVFFNCLVLSRKVTTSLPFTILGFAPNGVLINLMLSEEQKLQIVVEDDGSLFQRINDVANGYFSVSQLETKVIEKMNQLWPNQFNLKLPQSECRIGPIELPLLTNIDDKLREKVEVDQFINSVLA